MESNELHQLNDNYQLHINDSIDDIDDDTQHSITKLHLPKLFGTLQGLNDLDFSDYEFNQLEILVLGTQCLQSIKSLCFTSNDITIRFDYS